MTKVSVVDRAAHPGGGPDIALAANLLHRHGHDLVAERADTAMPGNDLVVDAGLPEKSTSMESGSPELRLWSSTLLVNAAVPGIATSASAASALQPVCATL